MKATYNWGFKQNVNQEIFLFGVSMGAVTVLRSMSHTTPCSPLTQC